jgi:hypothetical protein
MDYAIEHSLTDAGLEVLPQTISKTELFKILAEYFAAVALSRR